MPSLCGLSITHTHTHTHTHTLALQVRADCCRHALVPTEPGNKKWWNAGSRGPQTHTNTYSLLAQECIAPLSSFTTHNGFPKKKWENGKKKHQTLQKMISGRTSDLFKTICSDCFSSIHSLSRLFTPRVEAVVITMSCLTVLHASF